MDPMTGTAVAPKFATWSAPGHSFGIEYSGAVLEQIRETAVDGYHRVPHGGVETGGILFGTHQENVVRIMAWRPVACEYAKGPSFLLSEKDEAALAEAIKSWRGDAELARLEPIGWYRAHTRSEVLLSDADLTFFNRFFPQPWQVGLIVRPASFAPTRAGFFFREADRGIRAESSYLEFTLTPVGPAPAPASPQQRRAVEMVRREPDRAGGCRFGILAAEAFPPTLDAVRHGYGWPTADRLGWRGPIDWPCQKRIDRNRRPWRPDPGEPDRKSVV